jgi:hypothetical protein
MRPPVPGIGLEFVGRNASELLDAILQFHDALTCKVATKIRVLLADVVPLTVSA